MKILIAAGGTGGHVYPGIAIARELQNADIKNQILFVVSDEGVEADIISRERFTSVAIRSRGMLRKLSYKAISSPFIALIGLMQSLRIIRAFKPDLVIVMGGYVSLPAAFAAFLKRVPVILHEENVKPGISSRIIKWIASIVSISFEESRRYFRLKRRLYCFGNPVRGDIINAIKGVAIQNLGLRQDKKTVLIFGGSQGARSINNVVADAVKLLDGKGIQVIHVSGQRDYETIRQRSIEKQFPFYVLLPYMHNIADGYAAADLVISRAGATSISEITVRGIPSILIPFPYSAEGHQDLNAKVLSDAGACRVMQDRDMTPEALIREMMQILNDKELREFMGRASKALGHPEAATEIVKMIYNMAEKFRIPVSAKGKYAKKAK